MAASCRLSHYSIYIPARLLRAITPDHRPSRIKLAQGCAGLLPAHLKKPPAAAGRLPSETKNPRKHNDRLCYAGVYGLFPPVGSWSYNGAIIGHARRHPRPTAPRCRLLAAISSARPARNTRPILSPVAHRVALSSPMLYQRCASSTPPHRQ